MDRWANAQRSGRGDRDHHGDSTPRKINTRQINGLRERHVTKNENGVEEGLDRAAEELVRLNPDVILASASANALAVKKATSTIPIVVAALEMRWRSD